MSLQPRHQSGRIPADYKLRGFAATAAHQSDEAEAQETQHGGLGDVGTAEGDFADRAGRERTGIGLRATRHVKTNVACRRSHGEHIGRVIGQGVVERGQTAGQ